MNKRLAIIIVALALALVACEGEGAAYTSIQDLTAVANLPEGDQATARAALVSRYGTAQAAEAAQSEAQAMEAVARATRQAAAEAAQRQYVAMTADAQATRAAHERELEQKRAWATQQSANATQVAMATAQAVAVAQTAQAQALQATAAQRAWEATATAEAWNRQGTATAQAQADRRTATAEAIAWEATSTAQAWSGRQTATAESWQATKGSEWATATRQAEKRDMALAVGRDYGIPFVLLVAAICLGALIWYGVQQMANRPQVIERSILGDAQPLALKDGQGGWNLIDLDRQPGHVTRVLGSGETQAPQYRSAGQEERTTARDQTVDGLTRPRIGAGAGSRQPQEALPGPPQARPEGLAGVRVLRKLDQAGKAGLLPPGQIEAIEAVWEETEDE